MCNCILDIGNEEFLESTKIVGDRIKEVLDNGILGDDIYFWVDDEYECQDECKSRYLITLKLLLYVPNIEQFWQYIVFMYCRTGISTGTYNRNFRV